MSHQEPTDQVETLTDLCLMCVYRPICAWVQTRITLTYLCSCMYVTVCACVCFPHRLDMIVGPQPLSSRAKAFSSPSLPVYYSQRRKNSTQGSECPQPSYFTCFVHLSLSQFRESSSTVTVCADSPHGRYSQCKKY